MCDYLILDENYDNYQRGTSYDAKVQIFITQKRTIFKDNMTLGKKAQDDLLRTFKEWRKNALSAAFSLGRLLHGGHYSQFDKGYRCNRVKRKAHNPTHTKEFYMSQNENEQTARVLTGEESLTDGSNGLNILAAMYISLLARNTEFEQEVRQIVGEHFDELLQKRMRAMVPLLLDMLRNRKVVYAISNYMHFIAVSCPARGIPIEEFTSMDELRLLWREAHLRSARTDAPAIASAILAGITPEEMRISQTVADLAVDGYFGRNNPKRKDNWEAHKKDYDEMRKLLAV